MAADVVAATAQRGEGTSVKLLVLTAETDPTSVLPALALLPHKVRSAALRVAALRDAGLSDAVIVDARSDLPAARDLCQQLGSLGLDMPVVAVLTEGRLVAVSAEWGVDEIVLPDAGPAEVDARLRSCEPTTPWTPAAAPAPWYSAS